VPVCYVPSNFPYLRQGEIIENLIELGPRTPPEQTIDGRQTAEIDIIYHPYAIVVSQDCDLYWDYRARQGEAQDDKLLRHVLFCDLFGQAEIRVRSRLGSEGFKRVRQNQDERYHCLAEAPIYGIEQSLPELYADFKAISSLSVVFVYSLTSSGQATRRGFLPSPYLQHFVHRLHAFLGRVAIPES
jgi:hypothetical protein